jgi:hypothetical protein
LNGLLGLIGVVIHANQLNGERPARIKPEMSAAYIYGPIINPISMRLPPLQALLLLAFVAAVASKHDLLANVRVELDKMGHAYA